MPLDQNARFLVVTNNNLDLTEKKSARNNSDTEYFSLAEIAAAVSEASLSYIEVPISSAEILDFPFTPKVILPPAGVNKYYKIDSCIAEYNFNSIAYNFLGKYLTLENGYSYTYISPSLISSPVNVVGEFSKASTVFEDLATDLYVYSDAITPNLPVSVFTDVPPTLGDGTILIKIWYQIKTFGTEL